jgi:threonine/homoserine/homoserine lactone efflux protein
MAPRPSPQHSRVHDAILPGLVTGLAIAMPVGAVAALIVTLTARTSPRLGFGAALGVATVDGTYAAVAVLAGGVVAGALRPVAHTLQVGSVVVLLAIAVWLVVSALRPGTATDAGQGWVTTPLRAWTSYVAITAVNPTTVVYFAAVVLADHDVVRGPAQGTAFVLAAFLASAAWQSVLVGTGAALGRALTGPRGRAVTGVVSGLAIAVLALHSIA